MKPPGRAEDVPEETFAAALHLVLIVAYADEKFTHEERKMLREQVTTLSSSLEDQKGFHAFIDSLPTQVESMEWVESALISVRENLTDPAARRDAFAMALELGRADGRIDMNETRALLEIASSLEIDPEFARARLRRVRDVSQEKLPDLDKTPWQPGEKKT